MDDVIRGQRLRLEGGSALGGASAGRVCVRVVVRASGRQRGSGAARCMAAYGCVSASSLVRVGRQRGQRINQEMRLG